MDSAVSG